MTHKFQPPFLVIATALIAMSSSAVRSQSWTEVASIPTARWFASVASVNGKIYVIGGGQGNWTGLNTNECYDPATNTWSTLAPMPTVRSGNRATVVNNKIYVIGGMSGGQSTHKELAVNECYDPATNTWSTLAPMPTARYSPAIATIGSKIYVIGGGFDGAPNSTLTANECYDPATNTWTSLASMPTPRTLAAYGVQQNKIYVIGGQYGNWQTANERYDPATNAWATEKSLPASFGNTLPACTVCGRGIFILYNGQNLEYIPSLDTYVPITAMPSPRGNTMGATVNYKVYVIAGENQSKTDVLSPLDTLSTSTSDLITESITDLSVVSNDTSKITRDTVTLKDTISIKHIVINGNAYNIITYANVLIVNTTLTINQIVRERVTDTTFPKGLRLVTLIISDTTEELRDTAVVNGRTVITVRDTNIYITVNSYDTIRSPSFSYTTWDTTVNRTITTTYSDTSINSMLVTDTVLATNSSVASEGKQPELMYLLGNTLTFGSCDVAREMKVYDLLGRCVFSIEIVAAQTTEPLPQLPSGEYVVSLDKQYSKFLR